MREGDAGPGGPQWRMWLLIGRAPNGCGYLENIRPERQRVAAVREARWLARATQHTILVRPLSRHRIAEPGDVNLRPD